MADDFSSLENSNHWLDWIGDEPGQEIRVRIESALRNQEPSTRVESIRAIGEPCFLTSARDDPEDTEYAVLTRAGLALQLLVDVAFDDGKEQLSGVFSWVAANLNDDRTDRIYFDISADFELASEALKVRLYDPEAIIDLATFPSRSGPRRARRAWWPFGKRK
jgi:hypothetical protein